MILQRHFNTNECNYTFEIDSDQPWSKRDLTLTQSYTPHAYEIPHKRKYNSKTHSSAHIIYTHKKRQHIHTLWFCPDRNSTLWFMGTLRASSSLYANKASYSDKIVSCSSNESHTLRSNKDTNHHIPKHTYFKKQEFYSI